MSEILSAYAFYKQLGNNNKKKTNNNNEKKTKRKRKSTHPAKEIKSSNPKATLQQNVEEENETGSDSGIPELVPIEDSWLESSFFKEEKVTTESKKRKLKGKKSSRKQLKSTPVDESDEQPELAEIYSNFDEKAKDIFEWLIAPINTTDFFENYWEKRPLIIKRKNNIYKHILSTKQLDTMLRENSLFFNKNVDVVQYVNGKKENYNVEGRAHAGNVWALYGESQSIRILNPHTYNTKIHQLLSALQEYFGTMAGANVYLTPPDSQGFAPHYDDIEAFVLQLEGRKHWKLYAPRNSSDILPRFSSDNFKPEDLTSPAKEVTLEAGDLLYFPRGCIHEGYTDKDSHSLHITVSVYQRTSYADLLQRGLEAAIQIASEEDPEYRKGLPINYLKHVGAVHSERPASQTRETIIKTMNRLIQNLTKYLPIDAAADQLGKQFMWDALPPVLTEQEKQCTVHENGEKLENGIVKESIEITPDTKIRLLRYYSLRLVMEEDTKFRVYYSVDNANVYHEEEMQFTEIEDVHAPAIEYLSHNYPFFVKVSDIPIEDYEIKMNFVSMFWERGFLITDKPLSSSNSE